MKKIALMGLFAFGLAFTACDDYTEPNPPAQNNPQGPVFEESDIAVSTQVGASTTYDLEALDKAGSYITLATIEVDPDALESSYAFGAEVFISNNNFATQYPVDAVVRRTADDEWMVFVAPSDLQGTYSAYISKSPSAKQIGIRYLLTVEKEADNQVAYIGGPDNYYTSGMTVVPFPSDMVIEKAYYLIGTIDDWSLTGGVKFEHSDENPYDDPVFTVTFNITEQQAADGWWWKIIPQSTVDANEWLSTDYSQFGPLVDGSSEHSGSLMPKLNGQDPGAGDFQESGAWRLTINMMELTYEFSSAVTELYTPGNANGWNQGASQILTTNDFQNYSGFVYIDGEFKFTTQADWNGVNYGAGETAGTISSTGDNLSAEKGLYWCTVNTQELTYSLTPISAVGMIGGFNDWGGDVEMTPSDDYLTWTGTLELSAGSEWKFRMNNDWAINLGGAEADLVPNGANIYTDAGTYTVTLNLSQVPYACTVVKK